MQQCNAEDICRVGNLKKQRRNKKEKKKKEEEEEEEERNGLYPENGGKFDIKVRKI